MGVVIAISVIVIILVVIVVWGVGVQNKLVHIDELCGNALSQIGVQQASRWDALTALADMVKAYSDHEFNALQATIQARQSITPASPAGQVQQQEDLLSQVTQRVMMLGEAYPELKANTLYAQTMSSVNDYENQVRMSRMVYNDTVTKFNRIVRTFPDSLFAGIFGFHVREYLQMDSKTAAMPSMVR